LLLLVDVLAGTVTLRIVGVAESEGGAAGSLRAGSLDVMLASIVRAFSSALPHSRQVLLA